MQVIKPYVQPCFCPGWNQVGGHIAYVQTGDLQAGGFKILGPMIQRCSQQGIQHRQQAMNRVIRTVWVSHMPLRSLNHNMGVQAPTAANLDHFPQRMGVCRLTYQTVIGNFAPCGHPLQHLLGAIGCRAFLIPCNQQADRPFPHACPYTAGNSGQTGRYATFHVARTTAIKNTVHHIRSVRRVCPVCLIPSRHHVRVPCVADVRSPFAKTGKKIGGTRGPITKRQMCYFKTKLFQHGAQQTLGLPRIGRN